MFGGKRAPHDAPAGTRRVHVVLGPNLIPRNNLSITRRDCRDDSRLVTALLFQPSGHCNIEERSIVHSGQIQALPRNQLISFSESVVAFTNDLSCNDRCGGKIHGEPFKPWYTFVCHIDLILTFRAGLIPRPKLFALLWDRLLPRKKIFHGPARDENPRARFTMAQLAFAHQSPDGFIADSQDFRGLEDGVNEGYYLRFRRHGHAFSSVPRCHRDTNKRF